MNTRQRRHIYLAIITAIGAVARLCIINLDQFLHAWDERYHALVAKNLITFPLKPMLYIDPALSYDLENWSGNHIWLHKQPLFLWQMAASIWAFGEEVWAVRLPSAIMGTLLILITYDIANRWLNRTNTALLAAFLVAISNYQLELTSGRFGIEHNDITFGFYVGASLWALTRYFDSNEDSSKRYRWAVAVGLFSGLAILTKWLTGLLVFAGWGIAILTVYRHIKWSDELRYGLIALLTAALVAAPWQIYILHKFPIEAELEFAYNRLHVWEAVEGHTGSIWFYLGKAYVQYGIILWALIPCGVFAVSKHMTGRRIGTAMMGSVVVLYLFFSLIAKPR